MKPDLLVRLLTVLSAASSLAACGYDHPDQSKQISTLGTDVANEPVLLSIIAPGGSHYYTELFSAFSGIDALSKKDRVWGRIKAYPVVKTATENIAANMFYIEVDDSNNSDFHDNNGNDSLRYQYAKSALIRGMDTMESLNCNRAASDLVTLAHQNALVSKIAVDAIADAGDIKSLRQLASLTKSSDNVIKSKAIQRLSDLETRKSAAPVSLGAGS